MSNHTSISKVSINAPAARVWAALTEPELVKQWQFGSVLSTDWHAGSPIVFRTEWEGTVFEQKGTVLEFEPDKLARYTLFAPRPDLTDSPENYFTMTYLLEEKDGKTTLSIIQDDPRPQSEPSDEGDSGILNGLKKLVEG
jgi:uncharacterized protein YndB with AHSA1/START domain